MSACAAAACRKNSSGRNGKELAGVDDYVKRSDLLAKYDRQHKGPPGGARRLIAMAPAEAVSPVVFCDECYAHGLCLAEKIFLSEGIERPYCCRGNRGGNEIV